ncbi:hypothetical protein P43SY_005678 [Pythium insidiosum]|uniref:WW domain-containing protein n=1 Tax=Pythium insidiosum TaxID=114742 RepID=A0AAD5Q7P7_PYTIN|nr:hypothetical protein P43SY_005678 [Pythium insidiosum]
MRRPGRRGQAAADGEHADDAAAGGSSANASAEHRAVEFLRRSMKAQQHWRPSQALAKCLGVPHQRLMLTQRKEDAANAVWATTLVLVFCASSLAELHELWFELSRAATAWLYQQPHFLENRVELVQSAGALQGVRDVEELLTTMFPEPKDPETAALERALGEDWKICYLEEPPYSMYFWNEKTNHSTWRNPVERARQEKERREKKLKRDALLAKALPMRLRINRDPTPPDRPRRACDVCVRQRRQAPPNEATVLCLACESTYYCDKCCDLAHVDRRTVGHIDTSFRFVECLGIDGFPRPPLRVLPPKTVILPPDVVGTPEPSPRERK